MQLDPGRLPEPFDSSVTFESVVVAALAERKEGERERERKKERKENSRRECMAMLCKSGMKVGTKGKRETEKQKARIDGLVGKCDF